MKRSEFIRKWLKEYTEEKRDEMRDDLDALIISEKIDLLESLNEISKKKTKQMSWDYRILVEEDLFDEDVDKFFTIHKVYYNEDGNPYLYDKWAATVTGDNMDDILFCLSCMKEALNRSILRLGDKFPEEFNYDEWIKNKEL